MEKKRGRPRKKDARKGGYRLRLNQNEEKMLAFIMCQTRKTKADILRDGLKMQYNLAKYLE